MRQIAEIACAYDFSLLECFSVVAIVSNGFRSSLFVLALCVVRGACRVVCGDRLKSLCRVRRLERRRAPSQEEAKLLPGESADSHPSAADTVATQSPRVNYPAVLFTAFGCVLSRRGRKHPSVRAFGGVRLLPFGAALC